MNTFGGLSLLVQTLILCPFLPSHIGDAAQQIQRGHIHVGVVYLADTELST